MNVALTVATVFYIVFLVLKLWILKYTLDLKSASCTCAMDWRLTFIQFAIVFSIIGGLLTFYLPVIGALVLPVSVAFIIVGIMYIRDMKATKCQCSEARERDVLEIILYISAGIWVVGLSLYIYRGTTKGLLESLLKNGNALKYENVEMVGKSAKKLLTPRK
jgi:hypothetical protein